MKTKIHTAQFACILAVLLVCLGCNKDVNSFHTYENKEYAFSIQYPANWTQVNRESPTPSTFVIGFRDSSLETDTAYAQIFVTIRKNAEGLSLVDLYSSGDAEEGANFFDVAQAEDISVSGVPAIKFLQVPGPIPNTLTAIPRDGYVIEIQRHNDDVNSASPYNYIIDNVSLL